MEKEFIPYEIALAIKELGFEEECFGEYFQIGHYFGQLVTSNEELDIELTSIFECGAPLYQQVFKWFKEKYGYFQLFDYQHGDSKINRGFFFNIINIDNEDFFFPEDFENQIYKTYEEAELECVKKLIEITKENK